MALVRNQGIFPAPEELISPYTKAHYIGGDARLSCHAPDAGAHQHRRYDPVALVRNQGIFPAPEELISPYTKAHYIGGDARGSHVMPLMPVPINTAVTGMYCLPLVSCIGFSLNAGGYFSDSFADFFDNPAWDYVRHLAQEKGIAMRAQGWSGAAMLPYGELNTLGFR